MTSVRRSAATAVIAALASLTARAQTTLHYWDDNAYLVFWPKQTRSVSDLDGDGRRDLVFLGMHGGARAESSAHRGQVLVDYSAVDAALDHAQHVAPLDDIDGDGTEELAFVCERANSDVRISSVRVLSGRTGALVRSIAPHASAADFPRRAERGGDADGDGVGDVLIESWAIHSPSLPTVRIHSGANGGVLREFPSTLSQQVGVLGDVDGDGRCDYAVASSTSVRVVSGVDGSTLHETPRLPGDLSFGEFVSIGRDENADGAPELLTAALVPTATAVEVRVLSGADGQLLRAIQPPSLASTSTAPLAALHGCGDYDGDGFEDYAFFRYPAELTTFSGATGETLDQLWVSTVFNEAFDIGDLNGDGFSELSFTAHAWALTLMLGQRRPAAVCTGMQTTPSCSLSAAATGSTSLSAGMQTTPSCSLSAAATGSTSLSVGEPLSSELTFAPASRAGVLTWSTSRASNLFNGFSVCVGGPRRSIAIVTNGDVNWSCSGYARFEWSRAYLAELGLNAGETLYTQWALRDPTGGASPALLLSDAIAITLAP